MTGAFDNRLLRLKIALDGQEYTYDQNYYITATGIKYTSGLLGECALRIDNISRNVRDTLIKQTSPFQTERKLATITLDAGRESSGLFTLFQGQAVASNPTQPPDIGLFIRSMEASYYLGSTVTNWFPSINLLSVIARRVADDMKLTLDFQATDKTVADYSFSGAATKQVKKLNEIAGIVAFVDNTVLVVKDENKPRGDSVAKINKNTGLIGVPQITEVGINVRVLMTGELRVGQKISVESDINPAASGDFIIYTLSYDVSSWDTPFYWVIEARRYLIGTP